MRSSVALASFSYQPSQAEAAAGTLLATVTLPGNTRSVGLAFDGTYVMAPTGGAGTSGCASTTIKIYTAPPPGTAPQHW